MCTAGDLHMYYNVNNLFSQTIYNTPNKNEVIMTLYYYS